MKLGNLLTILSHLINIILFIYFSTILIKENVLNLTGLSVTAFGISMSLIANIISIIKTDN